MAENGNENAVGERQSQLMSEFTKLRTETTGIHSIFSDKSIDAANFAGNKLLKNIHDVCGIIMENQIEQETQNKKELFQIRKEVLEATESNEVKQEKTSQEILKEIRSIRKELEATKQKIEVLSIKNSTENIDVSTIPINSGQEMKESETMSATTKEFRIKSVFVNIASMKQNKREYSEEEEHFNIPWRLIICRKRMNLSIYLNCPKPLKTETWSVETEYELKLISQNGKYFSDKTKHTFGNMKGNTKYTSWGFDETIEWEKVEKDFIVDDKLIVEAQVIIKKVTGISGKKLRIFDETMKELSDVVLVVEDKKFYVFKLFLASQSSYFKSILMDKNELEVLLTGIDPNDFQIFLEVLYGEPAIDENSVEITLVLAKKFDAQTAIRRCEEFLIKKSEKTIKKKLQLALKYSLENLKKNCTDQINSATDIRSVVPSDLIDMDHSLLATLLEKTLSILQ